MAKVIIDDTNLKNIANTLREKLGTEDTLKVSEFADKIKEVYDSKPMYDKNWTQWNSMFAYNARREIYFLLDYDSTSNGTDFSYMFQATKFLTSNTGSTDSFQHPIKLLNTSNGTDFSHMFSNITGDIYKNIWPSFSTSNAKRIYNMFYSNKTIYKAPNMDFSKAWDAQGIFSYCNNLVSIGRLVSSGVTHWNSAFAGCSKLVTIESIDLSNAKSVAYMFTNCSALTNLTINGTINTTSLDLSPCPLLTHESLMSVINALTNKTSDTSSTVWTIKLGSENLAKLTDEEKLIMENKGWAYA